MDGQRVRGTKRHLGGGCSYPGRNDETMRRNPKDNTCTKNPQLSAGRATWTSLDVHSQGHSIYDGACHIVELDSPLALEMGT